MRTIAEIATHEAGHLLVALVTGKNQLSSRVGGLPDGRDAGTTFEGPLTAAIAVAGAAADMLFDDPAVTAEWCVDKIDCEGSAFLSATDRAGYPASREQRFAAFDYALSVLRDNPDLFSWACDELRTRGEITPETIRVRVAPRSKWRYQPSTRPVGTIPGASGATALETELRIEPMATVADREAREAIEQTIHTVAVRRLGVVDTSIVRHLERGEVDWAGAWFVLSVRLPGDGDWKFLGRRRTKAELFELVSTLAPTHLDGKCFR